MKLNELEVVAKSFMGGLPANVIDALVDVELLVCETPADAADELKAELGNDFTEKDAAEVRAEGCKGVFVGAPAEVDDEDDTDSEEEEVVLLPEGFIVLCASNIESADEAVAVLLHELGHALGYDEEEVKELGLGLMAAKEKKADTPNEGETDASQ